MDKEITDKDIYDACEILRNVYLHLDEKVMPFDSRLNHARYYGRLRLNLAILKARSDMKQGKEGDSGFPSMEESIKNIQNNLKQDGIVDDLPH